MSGIKDMIKVKEKIEKCCGHIPTLWGCENRRWVYVCQDCGRRQYEEARE